MQYYATELGLTGVSPHYNH